MTKTEVCTKKQLVIAVQKLDASGHEIVLRRKTGITSWRFPLHWGDRVEKVHYNFQRRVVVVEQRDFAAACRWRDRRRKAIIARVRKLRERDLFN